MNACWFSVSSHLCLSDRLTLLEEPSVLPEREHCGISAPGVKFQAWSLPGAVGCAPVGFALSRQSFQKLVHLLFQNGGPPTPSHLYLSMLLIGGMELFLCVHMYGCQALLILPTHVLAQPRFADWFHEGRASCRRQWCGGHLLGLWITWERKKQVLQLSCWLYYTHTDCKNGTQVAYQNCTIDLASAPDLAIQWSSSFISV